MSNDQQFPFISAKCLTYGRVEFLEEAIESFLRQDYPKDRCELVIVNDYAQQELIFDHPQVRIFNIQNPFKTIGEKENFAASQCKGDIICQFDDDDIALPNHFNNIVKWLTHINPILHWEKGAYWNEPKITDIVWLGNSGIAFWKEAWNDAGRYPLENAGYDNTFVSAMHKLGPVSFAKPEDEDVSWFYRWGFIPGGKISKVGCYHNSGMGTDDGTRPNIIERHSAHIDQARINGLIPTGLINLEPKWHYNYSQQLIDFNNKNK